MVYDYIQLANLLLETQLSFPPTDEHKNQLVCPKSP